MKKLRKLASIILLAFVLGLPAFAGQTDTPPCAPPAPGQTDTPPCPGAATVDLGSPTVSSTATVADETLTAIVTEVLESMLSIF